MLGRSGEDITARCPEIAEALGALMVEHFVLDGEIIAHDASGRPSFQRLQKRMLLTKPADVAAATARVPVRAVFFDSLALEGHELRHVTRVGGGFDDAMQEKIWAQLQPLARPTSPFGGTGPGGREDHWVEPRLVCEVRFTEWTGDGGLRHPIFLGMRTDKKPEEVRREGEPEAEIEAQGDAIIAGEDDGEAAGATPRPAAPRARAEAPHEVRLSNLKKVFWPDQGYTKGDLIAYYDAIAPYMLPYLRDRPIVLTRYPDGIQGKSFFQKDAPVFVPDWVRRESVYFRDSDRDIQFFVIDDPETLRYVANMGTILIHMWCSRLGSVERSD